MTERLEWIARDPASKRVLELARRVTDAATTLLITGESGAGKDHLARLIHELGSRRDAPFLKIDCASLPAELVESELFGHERGAFTGAVDRKLGRLELARGGTIVLDEVAALVPAIQAKLLRVLEERSFERLGGTETLHIDARLIALTNADLPAAVAAGRFREDLYFRLNVLPIEVPPLRARPGDIAPIAEHLFARFAVVHGKPKMKLSTAALRIFQAYPWPGNIREMKNVIERALILSTGKEIGPDDLPAGLRAAASGVAAEATAHLQSLENVEREVIRATLEATHYKIGRAAEILGITRKTLLDKRKKYGLD